MKLTISQLAQCAQSTAPQTAERRAGFFYHQSYTASPPRAPHHYLAAEVGPAVGSREFERRLRHACQRLRNADVSALHLVHSTFAALDSVNILTSIARHDRSASASVRRIAASLVDGDTRDAGSYSSQYAALLETALEPSDVPVRLVSWSGENHHLGRADAAVRMIDELAALELPPGRRVMLWGHSHAGNVFAIMSQLLASDTAAVEQFFEAAAIYYRWPLTGLIDIPVWHRVRRLLTCDRQRLACLPIDWVTFGTPVRYGWKLRDGDNLLHFIHHRPAASGPRHLAVFPARLEDVLDSANGDYLQQVAIAGTDEPPSPLAWRSWLADIRLGRLLAPDDASEALAARLQTGMRVPDCGTTLLVDYGVPRGGAAEQLAGHAVYTRPEWLLFHVEQIIEHLFGGESARRQAA